MTRMTVVREVIGGDKSAVRHVDLLRPPGWTKVEFNSIQHDLPHRWPRRCFRLPNSFRTGVKLMGCTRLTTSFAKMLRRPEAVSMEHDEHVDLLIHGNPCFYPCFCHRNTLLACTRHCDFGDACAGLRTVEEDGEEQQSIPDISDSVVKWMAESWSGPLNQQDFSHLAGSRWTISRFIRLREIRRSFTSWIIVRMVQCHVLSIAWCHHDAWLVIWRRVIFRFPFTMGWRSQLQMIFSMVQVPHGSSHFTSRKGDFSCTW